MDDQTLFLAGFLAGKMAEAGFSIDLTTDDDGNFTGEIEVMLLVIPYNPTRVKVQVLPLE